MLRHFCKNYTHSHNLQPIEIERTLILFLFCLLKNLEFFMSICNKGLYVKNSESVRENRVLLLLLCQLKNDSTLSGRYIFFYHHTCIYIHIFPLNNIHLFYIIFPPLHIPYITNPLNFITLCKDFLGELRIC